ncbi:MAG: hypothetical protein M5U12_24755 [Verrucomicrobia bacterium]|nr:hypothetical protein [Verrucomicrobiota bacterium]
MQFEPWRTKPSAGEIRAPVRSGTLVAGDWLRFSGSALPQGIATYRWRLSDGRAYSTREPGLVHFPQTGDCTVTYSVTADGSEDPHPDSRTYSVVAGSGRLPDLRVVHVQVAGTLAVGQTASLEYTVRNVGQGPAGAAWRDAAFLSRDPHLDTEDLYLGSTAVNRDLPADHSYRGTIPLTLPAVDEGAYHVILVLNHEWEVLEQHRLNNELATPITAEVPTLAAGVLYPVPHNAGRLEQYFRIPTPAGRNLALDLTHVPRGWEVFMRFGLLPTRTVFDYHQRGGESLLIPAAAPGDWYVLVYGDPAQTGEYHLRFSLEDLTLTRSTPTRHGTASDLELTLTGAGFTPPLQVILVASQDQTYGAARTDIDSFTQATATFPAGTVPAGTYGVRVSQGGRSAELPRALEITPGGAGNFHVQLILPAQFGYHILATVFVEYANTGETSLPAPLLLVTATQQGRPGAILTLDQHRLSSGFWTSAMPEGFAPSVQFLASGATPGSCNPANPAACPCTMRAGRSPGISAIRPWNGRSVCWMPRTSRPLTGTDSRTPSAPTMCRRMPGMSSGTTSPRWPAPRGVSTWPCSAATPSFSIVTGNGPRISLRSRPSPSARPRDSVPSANSPAPWTPWSPLPVCPLSSSESACHNSPAASCWGPLAAAGHTTGNSRSVWPRIRP